MKKQALLFMLISFFAFMQPVLGQTRPTNEERLIRVEEGVKNLNIRFDDMNRRIDAIETRMDKRFDELRGFMLWGFGITFSGMFILIGFILWDRRTTLAPVVNEIKYSQAEIEEWKKKEKAIIEALNKYAELDPKLKEILNKAALL